MHWTEWLHYERLPYVINSLCAPVPVVGSPPMLSDTRFASINCKWNFGDIEQRTTTLTRQNGQCSVQVLHISGFYQCHHQQLIELKRFWLNSLKRFHFDRKFCWQRNERKQKSKMQRKKNLFIVRRANQWYARYALKGSNVIFVNDNSLSFECLKHKYFIMHNGKCHVNEYRILDTCTLACRLV